MKPLDYYYAMVSSYYNFYGEAKNDIENIHAWIGTILVKYSGIATLAATYTLGADTSTINTYYDNVLNELTQNSGAQDSDHYSYVSGAAIDAVRIYVIPGLHTWSELSNKRYDVPRKIMSSTDILVMMERYKRLYSAGVTTSTTFADYLVSLKIYSEEEAKLFSNLRILTESSYAGDNYFPKNCSVTLTVVRVHESSWVKVGDKVKVGSNGKFSAEHFTRNLWYVSDAIDLNGNITVDYVFAAYCHYFEWHAYWFGNDEDWALETLHDGALYVFALK
jgi:hypothetical protein